MFPMHGGFMGRKKGGPITSGLLTLEFDDILNAPVADPTDVADWNTLFNLPTLGTPFNSVTVTGNIVELIGGENIELTNIPFSPSDANRTWLIRVEDSGCITTMNDGAGPACFRRQLNLSHVVLPECNIISTLSFRGCISLSVVNVPKAEKIRDFAFSAARWTSSTTLDFPLVTEVSPSAFSMDTSTTDTSLVGISLPACTTFTGVQHFRNRRGLASITCPLVTSFNQSFRDCIALASLDIPNCVTFADRSAQGCSSLTYLNIPICTTLGNNALDGCVLLNNLVAPNVTSIGNFSMQNTRSLVTIDLPELITAGNAAFLLTTNNATTTTVLLPKCTTLNGVQSLRRRTGLTTINLAACTQLGSTTGDDTIFGGISGNTITFTLPVGTRTDGDAVALASANTVTFLP